MISSYQEQVTDGDGFILKDGLIGTSSNGDAEFKELKEDDLNVSLEFILRSFRALDYFPDREFAIGSPISLIISVDTISNFDKTFSGVCEIDSPDYMQSSNLWDAEWSRSNLFEFSKEIKDDPRTYLPKDVDHCREGWFFSAPFLYSGIFVKDTVLRQRVLLSLEAFLYRVENKTISKTPHKFSIDNIFSSKNRPWQFNIPVLGA